MNKYAERFPSLAQKYSVAQHYNFEVLAKTIETHFSDLFDLSILEHEARSPTYPAGSYAHFFDACMLHLTDKNTIPEAVSALHTALNEQEDVQEAFYARLVFVPTVTGQRVKQISYLEKLATQRNLYNGEPLTYVDMLRSITSFKRMASKSSSSFPLKVTVAHLQDLPFLSDLTTQDHTYLVNLSSNLEDPPKWATILYTTTTTPIIYCETPLTESEKMAVEKSFGTNITYEGGTASHLPSTGYSALARLKETIPFGLPWDTEGDFPGLLDSFLFVQFNGDNPGVTYQYDLNEYKRYCTAAFQYFTSDAIDTRNGPHGWTGGRSCATQLAAILPHGKFYNTPFENSNIAQAIDTIERLKLKDEDLWLHVEKARQSRLTVIVEAMQAIDVLKDTPDKITLEIPSTDVFEPLNEEFIIKSRASSLNPSLFYLLYNKRESLYSYDAHTFTAALMLLNTVRRKSKKRQIEISMPSHVTLIQEDLESFINTLLDNVYVTQLSVGSHPQLQKAHQRLKSTLARNDWLHQNGYLPPLIDDYWIQAAKYWLFHLPDQPDLLSTGVDEKFKQIIHNMGTDGLDAVLRYLTDITKKDVLHALYGRNKPVFYAACDTSEMGTYLAHLSQHLREEKFFPFSTLGITYSSQHITQLITLCDACQTSASLDTITLMRAMDNALSIEDLNRLLTEAKTKRWTVLIDIPDLDDKKTLDSQYLPLHQLYITLNNQILRNRHEATSPLLTELDTISQVITTATVTIPPIVKTRVQSTPRPATNPMKIPRQTWPLKKSAGIQQQQQQEQEQQQEQQQQMEQVVEVQQEQEITLPYITEEPLVGELIQYDNIDKQLEKFYTDYKKTHPVSLKYAPLKDAAESELRGFFHTWVSKNPHTNASSAIHQMTLEAAKALIRHHKKFSSGIAVDNLPKGFYTQRSKTGDLILCYNPTYGVMNRSPLTLDLSTPEPKAKAWKGDFRVFASNGADTPGAIRQKMLLFSVLQPDSDYTADYQAFLSTHPQISGQKNIQQHWMLFLQYWRLNGPRGIEDFNRQTDFHLDIPTTCRTLCEHDDAANFMQQILDSFSNEAEKKQYLKKIGQIYYKFGAHGMDLFLNQIKKIHELDPAFFNHFNRSILSKSENFSDYMTETFFRAVNSMSKTLTKPESRSLWQALYTQHEKATGGDDIAALWNGFQYFMHEMDAMKLELDAEKLNLIRPPQNMLVCMDRLLACLKQLPDDQRQEFLDNIEQCDLTHGGIYYAIYHEGFRYFNKALALRNFEFGDPTYAPDLQNIYRWEASDIGIKTQRSLGMQAKFNREAYTTLAEHFNKKPRNAREQLLWLIHTRYSTTAMTDTLNAIEALNEPFLRIIARHIQTAIYTHNNINLDVHLNALLQLEKFFLTTKDNAILFERLLSTNDYVKAGKLIESLSILAQMKQLDDRSIEATLKLFSSTRIQHPSPIQCPVDLVQDVYKIATLFGQSETGINAIYASMMQLQPVVQQELRALFAHLLSIEYETSSFTNLKDNWQTLIASIQTMQNNPMKTADIRIHLIGSLESQGINFKYSKSGDLRAPIDQDRVDTPQLRLHDFPDHEEPLWTFIRDHLVIRTDKTVLSELKPLLDVLRHIQRNRSLINEIDPLLSILSEVKAEKRWLASHFVELLRIIQPKEGEINYPISLLKVMLSEDFIAARPMSAIQRDFPTQLQEPMKQILASTVFNRKQQSMLCQILLRELHWTNTHQLFDKVFTILSEKNYDAARDSLLSILTKPTSMAQLEQQFENCFWLLDHPKNNVDEVKDSWSKTAAIWLQALSAKHPTQIQSLLTDIQQTFNSAPEKQALVLHILAWSSLSEGFKTADLFLHELQITTPKLIAQFSQMDMASLKKLAALYPKQPAPSADELRRIIKQSETEHRSLDETIARYLRTPVPEPRPDYGLVSATRDADFQRMLAETQISSGEDKHKLSADQILQVSAILSRLKHIEHGDIFITNTTKPVSKLSQEELATAFRALSKDPLTDHERAELWAVLFEVLARTTGKYPHLAQQFALITNDISIDAPSRVLQLATGEGKSHFVALRAARHAGLGKTVDICTAKRTLAERDIEDYQNLFTYLGLRSAYITPKSSHETYTDSQIHYSTTGDLSLFLDEQSYLGKPIHIPRENRVGLFDEFDFIRFDEGRKTEYNFARPTGLSPKQMNWFYQHVNAFYNHHKFINPDKINPVDIRAFMDALREAAGEDEAHQSLISQLLPDASQCVEWIQSAHEAHALKSGVHYTIRQESIKMGKEYYPMREIIPLSSDNQKMAGSTFSAGVHQLLAVRLNSAAKILGQAQNYHIHPESQIISSQVAAHRMRELWSTWEGFTGTLSTAQAANLYAQSKTHILHVPTNQRDLRMWHPPKFYTDKLGTSAKERRLDALVAQIKQCFAKKQSILFSCKNDTQVKEIQTELKARLDANMFQQLVFYTNEDPRAAKEVLDDKKHQEGWNAGKKQQGIGLVASGFGRGDNVGVEAVFLFDVNDSNDQFQKGGRTARNGQEGEVFQFYLSDELYSEKKHLMNALRQLGVDLSALDAVAGRNPDEICFNQVMLLRECASSLQNYPHEAYHDALAQFSSFGMDILGKMGDTTRQEAAVLFNLQMNDVTKAWIDLASGAYTSEKKILKINAKIEAAAAAFLSAYPQSGVFHLAPSTPPIKRLIAAKPPEEMDETQQLLTSIYGRMTRLTDWDKDDKKLAKIKAGLDVLAKPKLSTNSNSPSTPEVLPPKPRVFRIRKVHKTLARVLGNVASSVTTPATPQNPAEEILPLAEFEMRLGSCTSIDEFLRILEITVSQAQQPSSAAHQQLQNVATKTSDVTQLLAISNARLVNYLGKDALLIPALQEELLAYLQAPNPLDTERRIDVIMPILHYLSRFTRDQQLEWGSEYIDNIPLLLTFDASTLLPILDSMPPMRYAHIKSLSYLAHQYASDQSKIPELLQAVGSTLHDNPEQRIRMFTKWESWALRLTPARAHPFLVDFAQSMQTFDKTNWDVLTQLVGKTQAWWNKDGLGAYQDDLIALWHHLGQQPDLKPLEPYIHWCLNLPGKAWFAILSAGLKQLDHAQLLPHFEQLKTLWETDSQKTPVLKKRQKVQRFETRCKNLKLFYQLIHHSAFKSQDKSTITQRLAQLPAPQFDAFLTFIQEHQHALTAYPNVLNLMLDYAEDSKKSPYIESLGEVFSAFYRANPDGLDALKTKFFSDDTRYASVYNPRSILTQLCNRGLLVGESWSEQQNQSFLNVAFQHYIKGSEKILGKKASEADLSQTQHTSLLQLTHELSIIAVGRKENKVAKPVQSEITTLIKRYKNRVRFTTLSTERSQQVTQIENTLTTGTNYNDLLQEIHATQLAILKSDMDRNANYWFYTGQSRLYKTLDKIENRILRHWTQNLDTMQSVDVYHAHFKTSFKHLTETLSQALSTLSATPQRSHYFFKPADEKINAFNTALLAFDAGNLEQTKKSVEFMRAHLSVVPGHMKALAKQILVKGEHMLTYLEKNAPAVQLLHPRD